MNFEWDELKNNKNIRERGIDFADAHEMFENLMITVEDHRNHYGETRYIGMGYIRDRLMVTVFTQLNNTIRIISLRKANKREQTKFKKTIQDRLAKG